jgi:DNA-binding response OmpR family regulator
LIVEDSLFAQQIYIALLKDSYHLELISTVSQASQLLAKQCYQCIILDLINQELSCYLLFAIIP